MIIQYVRKPGKTVNGVFQKGKPYGCLVGFLQPKNSTISVGWSICSPRDEWDRDVAQNIAWARATMCEELAEKDPKMLIMVPHSIAKEMVEFILRNMRYYKTDETTVNYAYECQVAGDSEVSVKGLKLI